MTNILDRIKNEPAAITGAVVAAITLAVAFGVPISSDQRSAIVGIVGAVLSLLGAGVVRSQVTPTRKVESTDTPDPAAVADQAAPTTVVRVIPRTDPRLGRHVEHDPRSRAFPAPATATITSKTWRHYGRILDQGQVGSCTGNAMAQALNTHPLHVSRTPYLTEGDADALYSLATSLDDVPGAWPPDDTGSSGLAVAKAAQEKGYITGYTHAFGLDHTLAALMNGPLIVGTNWTQNMFHPDAHGFVKPTGAVAGGHEYLLLGVNTDRGYATFLNSWGADWGLRGRFHMTLDDFGALLANGGDATQPVRA